VGAAKVLSLMASCIEASEPWASRARGAAKQSRQVTVSLWRISKQQIRQIVRPQPLPSRSRSELFAIKVVSISSSQGRLRREGEAPFELPKGGGEGDRWGDGLRVPVPPELGRGPPVHVRTQMAHVDALHLAQTRGGLGLIVRWHDVQVEILEGFREVTKRDGASKGTRGFDKRRRRLS
jgi:hypothetical protein